MAALPTTSTAFDALTQATVVDRPRTQPQGSPHAQLTLNGSETARLTRAIRRGDLEAFARFYDLYSFRLYKFLLVLAAGNDSDAREVCQSVFIKLAKRFKVFDDEPRLWSWLCTVGKNAFIDYCRSRQRAYRLVPLDELGSEAAPEATTEERLAGTLREILACLPPAERELLEAAYVDQRRLQELADASGQTYKALECRLARLRQRLKQQLLKHLSHEQED